jgi:hypothetical protein
MAFKIPIREELLLVTAVVAWTESFEQMDDLYSWETGVRFTSFIGDSQKYLFELILNSCSQSS